MAGNTFGTIFSVTTWGESHGPAIGAVIDGCPPGLQISEKDIQSELSRRKPGQNAVGTSRKEADEVKILSGVFQGKTTGTPISLLVENKDHRSKDYTDIKDKFRPGHADLAYQLKYGTRDYRGGGRSSGRETVGRVMGGSIAKKYLLKEAKTTITGHTIQIGEIISESFNKSEIGKNSLRCADAKAAKKMEKLVLNTKQSGDTIGGIVELRVQNTPIGLGLPVFNKLEADLAKALMSIGAVKGVEFGAGFNCALLRGSENNDEIICDNTGQTTKFDTKTNNAGGIYGGISIGTDLIIRIAVKPAASISLPQNTADKNYKSAKISVKGRHDACIIPRLIPVAESMVAITLMDHYLMNKCLNLK